MKNLIAHLQESLRIGLNDKPENNIDEFMGPRCLYAIFFSNPHLSSLRNNEKFSFNIYDIENWSIIDEEDKEQLGIKDEEQLSINIRKGNSLMWTSLFTVILLYGYSGWGFFFQKDRSERSSKH